MNSNWLIDYSNQWHDTWELIGAFATLCAVLLALVGFWFEATRAARAETRAERAEEALAKDRADADSARISAESERVDRERRAQALLVIGWAKFKPEQTMLNGATLGSWEVRVGNYSGAPVFDVRAEAIQNNSIDKYAETPVLAPGRELVLEATSIDETSGPNAVLYFRDVAGRYWRRLQSGALSEVNEHRQPI
ncbi:hypothetical protein [Cellulomonas chengniuliangii]|uniref:Uncharacterized protein n=1 Tax=Cellulomonas chengniuliangii TaxID=2968084 RepID=A0ABY5L382_9CELL|nr:hypothetical protein [Cellulomonas chengniuliangii]MCC2307191.1 hypothetical protein [Cellulomonas chengniuliangii]UUI76012.1 hypothetical protein NP064_03650 [Cellulomonas chengniuliangii]